MKTTASIGQRREMTCPGVLCRAVAAEIGATGRRAVAISCDVGRWDGLDAMAERLGIAKLERFTVD